MAEFNLTPVFRMEKFIDAIINGTTPPEPQFREEFYFAKVAGMDVELPTPITRREFYLAKYAGMNVDPPAPVTRDEMYLALACGLGVEPPEPVFRDEYWLYELSGGGGWSWKTVSGSMIHITDAVFSPMQKCEVTLEPIQDLHGQDAPYPAGGGKNIAYLEQGSLDMTTGAETSSTTRVRTNFIPVEYASPVGIYYVASSQNNGWSVRNGIGYDENKSYVSNGVYPASDGKFTVLNPDIKYVRFIYSHVNTSESCSPSDYWYQFERGSTPTTYSPYSNICPITGWTGCEVTRTGANLFDKANATTVKAYFVSGASSLMSGSQFETVYLPCKPNTTYSIKNPANNRANLAYTKELPAIGVSTFGGTQNTITTGSDAEYLVAYVFNSAVDTVTFDDVKNTLQISVGDVPTDYEAPNITTLSVTFPETVYGGKYDFVGGSGVIDEATISITEDMIYNYNASRNAFMVLNTSLPESLRWEAVTSNGSTVKFSHGEIVQRNDGFTNVTNGACCGSTVAGNGGILFVKLANNFSDLATAKAYVTEQYNNGTPLQVTYKLATPTEISLTPQPISTLKGENNIWGDGTITTIYKAQA